MRARLLLLTVALLCSGCAIMPPGPLKENERWQDVMRDGFLKDRGTLYVHGPRLEQPKDLELAETAPMTRENGESAYWPQALSAGFVEELRWILQRNSGYEVTLWSEGEDAAAPEGTFDFELSLEVTKLRLELVKVGMGSAMASMWLLGLPHLATYYNAPDEVYRCEYELTAELTDTRSGEVVHRRELRTSKQLALTDFQRGWTLYSYWPEQTLRWLPEHDHLEAWTEYGPTVVEAVEPHARRELLIEVMRFLREGPAAEQGEGTGYALVVGVDAPQAAQAERDAAVLAERLRETGLGARSLLGASASGDEVQRLLWERVGRSRPGELLVLAFSGCGGGPEPSVLLSDRPLPLSQLLEPLRAARRRGARVLVLLDAGFTGGARCAQPVEPAALAALEERLDGVFLWLASRDAQGAHLEADGRGAFSARILEGLSAADAGGDGLTLAELAAYVGERLPQSALLGPADRSLVLRAAPETGAAQD